jgi:hypothetical protein
MAMQKPNHFNSNIFTWAEFKVIQQTFQIRTEIFLTNKLIISAFIYLFIARYDDV